LARVCTRFVPALRRRADDHIRLGDKLARRRHLPQVSLGSRSPGGERTIERLLSVDQTCRLQRRSLYAYLSGPRPRRQSTGRPRP